MEKHKTTIEIKASPATLWNILTDFSNAHLWNPEIQKVTIAGPDPFGEGTMIEVSSGSSHLSFHVEACTKPEYLRIRTTIDKHAGVSEFILAKTGDMTMLEHKLEINTNGSGPLSKDGLDRFNTLWKWIEHKSPIVVKH